MTSSSTAKLRSTPPTALTIAGFDPGTGAGITADLLTLSRFGLFGTSAITALTVQSTRGVRQVHAIDPELLRATLQELEADLPATGIKIGMLGSAPQVQVVAEFLQAVRKRRQVVAVLDPVLQSSSGAVLLDLPGLDELQTRLLPLLDAVTPNTSEAELLAGLPCRDAKQAEECAAALASRYPQLTPIITGGHLAAANDLVWDRGQPAWIRGERLSSNSTHGTGCAFSTALLARRLAGDDWLRAGSAAKDFVAEAIRTATPLGSGKGPMNLIGQAGRTL